MRPRRSQNGRFRPVHNSFYNRCLHETGMNIAQTGLKASVSFLIHFIPVSVLKQDTRANAATNREEVE